MKTALGLWGQRVDATLPNDCPKCNAALDMIRYTADKDRMVIHLTRRVIESDWFNARCPRCDHVLKSTSAKSAMEQVGV